MTQPTVSIHVKEDVLSEYIKAADDKLGAWEDRRQVTKGTWNKWGLSRSSAYVQMVTKGQIVRDTKQALDFFQANQANYGGFIIVPLNPKKAALQTKMELLGDE